MTTTVLGLSAVQPLSPTRSTHRDVSRLQPARPLTPRFVFDFRAYDDPDDTDQRWSTWHSVEPLCRGPEPRPDWVVTSQAAIDTDLGILKTGKEADVFLLERAVPDDGRGGGDGRQALPQRGAPHLPPLGGLHRGSPDPQQPRRPGAGEEDRPRPAVAAGQWAWAEWESLKRLWSLGLPVPYPVQIDGTEMLMEWITHDGESAPAAGPDPARPRPAGVATSTRCATRWPSWPGTGSSTATCRRTTSSRRASAS